MIFTLVARQKQVLVEYSPHQGNFSQLTKEIILPKVNLDKMYSLFDISDYEYYIYTVDKFTFMAMFKKGKYVMQPAVSLTKLMKDKFYLQYGQDIRRSAEPAHFDSFVPFLKLVMEEANE